MEATTIKLDGPILKELKEIRSAEQSLTSLVRDLLQSEIHRRKMASAAEAYTAFLKQNPEEREEMESWAVIPFDQDVAVSPAKKRS